MDKDLNPGLSVQAFVSAKRRRLLQRLRVAICRAATVVACVNTEEDGCTDTSAVWFGTHIVTSWAPTLPHNSSLGYHARRSLLMSEKIKPCLFESLKAIPPTQMLCMPSCLPDPGTLVQELSVL